MDESIKKRRRVWAWVAVGCSVIVGIVGFLVLKVMMGFLHNATSVYSDMGEVVVVRADDGTFETTLRDFIAEVFDADFSPDGKLMVTVDLHGETRMYQTSGWRVLWKRRDMPVMWKMVEFSPDGKSLVLLNHPGLIRKKGKKDVYDVQVLDSTDGKLRFSKRGPFVAARSINEFTTINSPIAFSRDGTLIFANCESGNVEVYSASNGSLIDTMKGWGGRDGDVKVSPSGKFLAATDGKRVSLWRIEGKKLNNVWNLDFDSSRSVNFSPDEKYLAVQGQTRTRNSKISSSVVIRRVSDGRSMIKFEGAFPPAAFSPDGSIIAIQRDDRSVMVYDCGTWRELSTLVPVAYGVLGKDLDLVDLQFIDNRSAVASVNPGYNDGFIVCWDGLGVPLHAPVDPIYSVTAIPYYGGRILAVSPDGKTIIAGGSLIIYE